MRFISFAALLVAATGCTKPTSGEYTITFGEAGGDCEAVEDTGGDTGGEAEPENVAIVVAEDGKSITFGDDPDGDGGFTNVCSLNGVSFECPFYNETSDEGNGTTVTIDYNTTGKWTSSSSIEGTLVSSTACEGPDCASFEEFGYQFCTAEVSYTGELVTEE
jgi:hypothetical protein